MGERFFPVKVGDAVMISPEYWSRSGNGTHFAEPYKSNGPDHIYIITRVSDDYFGGNHYASISLDGDGGWDNEYEYLWPVVQFGVEEELSAVGDVSVLFE